MKTVFSAALVLLLTTTLGASVATAQVVYTFTTAGAEGTAGPDQAMLDAEYSGTSLDGQVTSSAGIQLWTVPVTGPYRIEAFGAQGFGNFGGRGAHITGEFILTAGDSFKILVGQRGAPYLNFPSTTYNHQFSGGGGSFVTLSDNTPLVVAGGGGGSHAPDFLAAADGQITENGAAGALGNILGAGGSAGSGGLQASSADGGGGLTGNGGGLAGGQAFVNGGLGGFDEGFGGFGGGGGTSSWNNYRGGGGGGYSGGGGGNNGGSCCAAGGGGGSFNAGTSPVNLAGVQLGDGLVRITNLRLPPAFSKTFAPDAILAGGVSTLTFSIDNSASVDDADTMAFTSNLPAGVLVATPANSSNTCGGTLTATSGSGTIELSGGAVIAGASCTVSVDVSAAASGSYVSVSGELTSNNGNSGTAADTLEVAFPPLFSKSFAPPAIAAGGISTLSYVIDNTANTLAAAALTFTDNLPAGLVVATPANNSVGASCSGAVLTASAGSSTVSLAGATLAGGETCTISVDVSAAAPGEYNSVSGNLTSDSGDSGTAGDTLLVSSSPLFSKSFAAPSIAPGNSLALSFVIDNTANAVSAGNLAFTDNLPIGMLVASPANANNGCGGTLSATPGSPSISLANGTVPALASCTVTVRVFINPELLFGDLDNDAGTLSSDLGSSPAAATATLQVRPPVAVPTMSGFGLLLMVLLLLMSAAVMVRRSGI